MTKDKHSNAGKTVLVIDDDDLVRGVIREYLVKSEFKVLEAENGKVGLEVFEREKPDLVLVDLYMRELDGLEVLRRLKNRSLEIPLLVVSGTNRICDAVEALHEGAWDIILKPIDDFSVLINSIENNTKSSEMIRQSIGLDELKEVEAGFREIVNNMPNISIQGFDQKRRVIFWNKASESLYGYGSDDAASLNMEDLLCADSAKENMIELFNKWLEDDKAPIPSGMQKTVGKDLIEKTVYSNWIIHRKSSGESIIFRADIDLTVIES